MKANGGVTAGYAERQKPRANSVRPVIRLSNRGVEVARKLAADGWSIPRIAGELHVGILVARRELKRNKIRTSLVHVYCPNKEYLATGADRANLYTLTEVGHAHVKELLSRDATVQEIAKELGVSDSCALRIIKTTGHTSNRVRKLRGLSTTATPAQKLEIIRLFLQGKTKAEISVVTTCNQVAILDVLEQAGIPRKRIGEAMRRLTEEDRKVIFDNLDGYVARITSAIDYLWDRGWSPTKRRLLEFGIPVSQHNFAVAAWRLRTRRTTAEIALGPKRVDTVAKLLPFLDPVFSKLPNTPATNPKLEPHDPYYSRYLGYVAQIADDRLRNVFGFLALIDATGRESFYSFYCHLRDFHKTLNRVGIEIGYDELFDQSVLEPFIADLMKGKHPGLVSQSSQETFLGIYRMYANKQLDYLQGHAPLWRERLAKYTLLNTRNMPMLFRVRWNKDQMAAQRARRKADTSLVHEKYYEIRFITQLRLNSVRRLYKAAVSAARSYDYQRLEPLKFSYEEHAVDERGRTVGQRVTCELWDYRLVAQRTGEQPGEDLKKHGLLLRLVSIEALNESGTTIEPWWKELVSAGLTSVADNRRRRTNFNIKWGYPPSTGWEFPVAVAKTGRSVVQIVRLQREHFTFVDYQRLYFATLTGALVVQVGTKTGMRVGEMQQMAASRDCLLEIRDLPGRKDPAYAVQVIPKGRQKKELKYIDSKIWDGLVELAKFITSTEEVRQVPIVKCEAVKTGLAPGRYFFQFRGGALNAGEINQCLRFVLHGLLNSPETGKHLRASVHMFRHAFAAELREQGVSLEIIAKLLSHTRLEPTEYYSEPPLHRVRDAAERIFVDRIVLSTKRLRNPDEIKQMLSEAQETVGALTEVTGGTCMVGSMCPAKFVCVGCAGNAPNPKKRPQVEEKKKWAAWQLDYAQREGLAAEGRQAKQIIDDCDLMLEEMRLIEIADGDAHSPPEGIDIA